MFELSLLGLVAFTTVASVDGFWFHLYRYRLFERPECRREHLLHTLNALLFPLTLVPVFACEATGAWLWASVLLFAATFAIESLDVFTEGDSRRLLGGLTPTEYWMHFLMSGLRWGYTLLGLASVPGEAWSAPASLVPRLPTWDAPWLVVPWAVALVGVPVALLHVWLALRPAPRAVPA